MKRVPDRRKVMVMHLEREMREEGKCCRGGGRRTQGSEKESMKTSEGPEF